MRSRETSNKQWKIFTNASHQSTKILPISDNHLLVAKSITLHCPDDRMSYINLTLIYPLTLPHHFWTSLADNSAQTEKKPVNSPVTVPTPGLLQSFSSCQYNCPEWKCLRSKHWRSRKFDRRPCVGTPTNEIKWSDMLIRGRSWI